MAHRLHSQMGIRSSTASTLSFRAALAAAGAEDPAAAESPWARPVGDVLSALDSYLASIPPPPAGASACSDDTAAAATADGTSGASGASARLPAARVAVVGGGFGGFVALHALASAPTRFAAGVTLGGISARRGGADGGGSGGGGGGSGAGSLGGAVGG